MIVDEIDWSAAWKEYSATRRSADAQEYWNKRAPSFKKKAGTSPYTQEFLRIAGIQAGESVLDMGCGSGTLALPLAKQGCHVHAADFSQTMLELLNEQAEADGVAGSITTQLLAWADDWSAAQVPVCDVALASRSISTDDLAGALQKLDSHAARRVCLTLSTGQSPRFDNCLVKLLGRETAVLPEYVYAMNMLWQMGRSPELRMIESPRVSLYESPQHALEKNAELFDVTPDERRILEEYVSTHMYAVQTEEGQQWRFDHDRTVGWACISWNK